MPSIFESLETRPAARDTIPIQESYVNSTNKKTLVAASLILFGMMVLALAAALLTDFSKLGEVFRHLEWGPFLLALFSTGSAYLASALSFRVLFGLTPYRVPFSRFFPIMFISDTVNFIISSGGMSSIANRAFLLKQEKVPYSVSIPLSLVQNLVFNLVLSGVCLGGLAYLHGHPEMVGAPKQMALLSFMAGLLAVMAGMVLIFFHRGFRRWVLGQILRAGHGISRIISSAKIDDRQWEEALDQVESTLDILRQGRVQLLLVFFWVSLNWCLMALTFYFCFHAVGLDLHLGLLLVGFTVMFLSSNVNPVPAGLGVSESLLAFIFKLLGVGFEETLVAAILFRLVYYLIPLAISAVLYLDALRLLLKPRPEEGFYDPAHEVPEKKMI